MNQQSLLFVALDGLTGKEEETLEITGKLAAVDGRFGFKVNLDYFLAMGINEALNMVVESVGVRPIFADLKMWNGSRTMRDIARQLVEHGVDYFNVWTWAEKELKPVIGVTNGTNTKVLGLTVLTHYDDAYCQRMFGKSLRETVVFLSDLAMGIGCDGIILPGTCLDDVSDLDAIKLVPGVRPAWYSDTRHEQEITPKEAVQKGANILVCGSPIMKAEDPVEALERILEEMSS